MKVDVNLINPFISATTNAMEMMAMCKPERKKVYLLSDCSSLIPGFEEETKKFENDMKALGANVILSSDIKKYV